MADDPLDTIPPHPTPRPGRDVPTSRVGRTARFGGMVAGQGARWVGMRAANAFRTDERADRAQADRAGGHRARARRALGEMKGAAMKLGQVLSTIDFDLVPEGEREAFKATLASLRDDAPRVPFSKQRKLMEQDLGGKLSSFFSDFDEVPIAAASIGQVYRARTLEGRDVAVKVQYPGIAEAVETDLRNMNILLPLVKRLAPGLDVRAIAGELRDRIGEELDYEIEAQNQRRVGRAFRGHPFITVPGVDTSLSTRRVLVTDFVDALASRRSSGCPRPSATASPRSSSASSTAWSPASTSRRATRTRATRSWPRTAASCSWTSASSAGWTRPTSRTSARWPARSSRGRRRGQGLARPPRLPPEPDRFVASTSWTSCGWPASGTSSRLPAAGPRVRAPDDRGGHLAAVAVLRPDAPADRPAQALLIRRMEGLLFSVLGELRAGADWGSLALEYIAGRPPATELGRIEEEWLVAAAA
jgi:hypothetical protein